MDRITNASPNADLFARALYHQAHATLYIRYAQTDEARAEELRVKQVESYGVFARGLASASAQREANKAAEVQA